MFKGLNIQCHEYNIERLRDIIRKQTILGLVFSTLSGTLSVGQFGVSDNSTSALVMRVLFMIFSFSIAIVTGGLKIYQIQERLEENNHLCFQQVRWKLFI
jgi:hypothetical protein